MAQVNKTDKKFIIPILALVISSIILVATINTYIDIKNFKTNVKQDIKHYKEEYLEKNKQEIYKRVHFINDSIDFQLRRLESKAHKTLQERITIALNVADFIYTQLKGKMPNKEIKNRIIKHLASIKFNNGMDYYFVYNSKTNIMLGHILKQYIGKDMTNETDIKGTNIISLYNNALKNKKIAFVKNYFYKPNDTKQEYEKIVAVAKFEPLDLVIGTGEYIDDIEAQVKSTILDRFAELPKNKTNYVFIYKVNNINGGENFATMILNQNRPDLVGGQISDYYKDYKGKLFIKEFLDGLRKNGEAYTTYWYQKPHTKEIKPKMSYFYYVKKWNWFIGSGFYFDDLDKVVQEKKKHLEKYTSKLIKNTLKITIFTSLVIIFIAVLVALKIDNTIESYLQRLALKSKKLKTLNQSLEDQVELKTKQNIKQLEVLQQQSKLASMGEMIGAIAHQWRQPLNAIATSIQNLKYDFKEGKLNDETYIQNFITTNKQTIKFMSKTIDDFRSFFRIDKEKKEFKVKETTQAVINMQMAQLSDHNIEIQISGDEFEYKGLQSEYQQVILNLISNAKDVLVEKGIKEPAIEVVIKDNTITISDNGGGIPKEILSRIFEPYFTTKEQGKGTGMGLYMSKMIIEENMNGALQVHNGPKGAVFTIILN